MPVHTTSQKMARAAYAQISARHPSPEYTSFAREFPTMVHSCGLAQAVAFARAKKKHQLEYVNDLAAVLTATGHRSIGTADELANRIRAEDFSVASYLRLTRNALTAAVWLKRYVETAAED